MVKLEHWNGKKWVARGEFYTNEYAWQSLNGDDGNYRTVDSRTGAVITNKRLPDNKINWGI